MTSASFLAFLRISDAPISFHSRWFLRNGLWPYPLSFASCSVAMWLPNDTAWSSSSEPYPTLIIPTWVVSKTLFVWSLQGTTCMGVSSSTVNPFLEQIAGDVWAIRVRMFDFCKIGSPLGHEFMTNNTATAGMKGSSQETRSDSKPAISTDHHQR